MDDLSRGANGPRARKRIKRQRREAREAQKYDADPPRCGNCTFYLNAAKGNEFGPAHGPECNLGKFPVTSRGLCDKWQSTTGETLAP